LVYFPPFWYIAESKYLATLGFVPPTVVAISVIKKPLMTSFSRLKGNGKIISCRDLPADPAQTDLPVDPAERYRGLFKKK
jgi:hypothetical protein